MSAFNPESFLDAQITESMSTQFVPIPEGEFVATVKKVSAPRQAGESWVLPIAWNITDPAVKEVTGLDENTAFQDVWLDLNSTGSLDFGKGKNVGLGRLREAMGLNQPGAQFSFRMLEGRSAKIKVKQNTDKEGVLRSKVSAVSPLA